jgi:tRNA A37 N6-isopentenylltransferase MiaA
LGKKYGWDSEAMTGNIYPIIRRYLAKELTLEQAKEQSITVDWRLAKRQLTWLKRNAHIHWLPLTEVKSYVFGLLAKQ